jgi:tRNA G18 (ribose-2'-O)-methylase SpoU
VFVAESPHVVRRLLASGWHVRSVLVTPGQYDVLAPDLAATSAPVYVAPISVLRRVVGFDLHRGAVAAADRRPLPPVAEVAVGARRIVVCEGLNDHENLGVLFRNAAAFGVDAVLLDGECADPLYRRCVRVSIGHVLTVPWTRCADVDEVAALGFTTYALTPRGDVDLDIVDWADRTALLVGSEGHGLSATWLARADVTVRIAMADGVDSLNVAAATAIASYVSRPARRR